MNITLGKASMKDASACAAILDSGRAFQREQGFVQWADDYPNLDSVLEDIESGNAHILKADGQIAGYMYISFDGDPAYNHIKGAWRTQDPYAVIHRVAFDGQYRGRGLSATAFSLAGEFILSHGVRSVRIDTHHQNKRMQHVLTKNGFVLCGEVQMRGEPRLAYDKLLQP